MRETVSLASSYGRQDLPASLTQRLDVMPLLALAAHAQPNGRALVRQPPPRAACRSAHVLVLAWFNLVVIASSVVSAGTIFGLRALEAGASAGVRAPAVAASSSHSETDWDTVHMTIDRSQRMRAPLLLQVTGADDGAFQVVMHGLPVGARPSRGAPIGEGTWLLNPTELDGLYLTLDGGVPNVFDMKIAVLTGSSGIATAGSIVEVRLVEMAPVTQAAVTVGAPVPVPPLAYAGMSDGSGADLARAASTSTLLTARSGAARGGNKAAGQQPVQRRPPVVTSVGAPSGQPADTGKTWPAGAYGLGATPHEPEQGTSWWQMPPPTWSPFLVGQEQP